MTLKRRRVCRVFTYLSKPGAPWVCSAPGFAATMPIDWDEYCAYTTLKKVSVRHRYIGGVYYVAICIIFLYTIIAPERWVWLPGGR